MSKDESNWSWVEDENARLSRIKEIAENADSLATIHLRQLVRELIMAKAELERNPIGPVGDIIGEVWKNLKKPDGTILKELDETLEFEKAQLKNNTNAILEKVSVMKASQLYKVAEYLKNKTITEIRNLLFLEKLREARKAFDLHAQK